MAVSNVLGDILYQLHEPAVAPTFNLENTLSVEQIDRNLVILFKNQNRRNNRSSWKTFLQELKETVFSDSSKTIDNTIQMLHAIRDSQKSEWPSEKSFMTLITDLLTIQQRTELLMRLVAGGFYLKDGRADVAYIKNSFQISIPPEMVFAFNGIPAYCAKDKDWSKKVLHMLETYLEIDVEKRFSIIAQQPFYCHKMSYKVETSSIMTLIATIAKWANLQPSGIYYRNNRDAYVNALKDAKFKGHVTTATAVEMLVLHAGSEKEDRQMTLDLISDWPECAKIMKEVYQDPSLIVSFSKSKPRLSCESKCHSEYHELDSDLKNVDFVVLRDSANISIMKEYIKEGSQIIFSYRTNRHPRRNGFAPMLISFSMDHFRLFLLFPESTEGTLIKEVLAHLTKMQIIGMKFDIENFKDYFQRTGRKRKSLKLYNLGGILGAQGIQPDLSSIAQWVHGTNFCPFTSGEIFEDPLTEMQEKHINHYLQIIRDTLEKLGSEKIAKYVKNAEMISELALKRQKTIRMQKKVRMNETPNTTLHKILGIEHEQECDTRSDPTQKKRKKKKTRQRNRPNKKSKCTEDDQSKNIEDEQTEEGKKGDEIPGNEQTMPAENEMATTSNFDKMMGILLE